MFRSLSPLALSATMLFFVPATNALVASPVHAQSTASLRAASDRYRDAVLDFERHVFRAGYFDRYEKQLADRLEDVSGDFRSATRDSRNIDRLLFHWNDLTTTHERVELTLVRGCSRPDPELLRCWVPVAETFVCLVEEMRCLTGGHSHVHRSNRPSVEPFPSFADPRYRDPRLVDPRFNGFQVNPPAVQLRPSTPPFTGSRGAQVEPRREIGAIIAATLLNRLLN
jgi:hypothetical protein